MEKGRHDISDKKYRWTHLAAVVLLCIFWIEGNYAAKRKTPTFDEIHHTFIGYTGWQLDDYRFQSDAFHLFPKWATIPWLWMKPTIGAYEYKEVHLRDAFKHAYEFYFKMGNDAQALVVASRQMMLMVGLALGVLIYYFSLRFNGIFGALLSLGFFCFSPTVISLSSLAIADMFFAFTLLLAAHCFWNFLHRITWTNAAVASLSIGAMVLSKLSSVGFIPMALVMSAVAVLSNRPMEIDLGFFQVKFAGRRRQRLAAVIGAAFFALVGCILVIWAIYGFRYTAENEAMAASAPLLGWNSTTYPNGWFPALVKTLNRFRILPETVLYGFSTIGNITRAQLSYILGRYSLDGFWYYYPVAFVLKTAWPFQIVLLWRIGLAVLEGCKSIRMRQTDKLLENYYRAVPLIVVAVVYTIFAMYSTINIGIRHFMPVYVVLFIFAGGVLKMRFRSMWINASILAAVLAVAATVSVGARSNYLAYFSFLPGGKKNSYRYLTDSNIDWGGELLAVKAWLDAKQQTELKDLPVYISYFGSASPEYYGIKDYIRLPGYNYEYMKLGKVDLRPLRAGIYVISPVSFITTAPHGRWTGKHEQQYQQSKAAFEKITQELSLGARSQNYDSIAKTIKDYDVIRMGKLCAYLKQREPDDIIADSILVYILTEEELKKAT